MFELREKWGESWRIKVNFWCCGYDFVTCLFKEVSLKIGD